MWTALASAGAAVFGAFGKLFGWLTKSDARRAAKAEGQAEFMQEIIEDVDDANKARRRVRTDADFARRVRDKYTRPD